MGELELEVEFEGTSGVSQYANPKVETLKFITQTTNYKDNELSLIAERITHPCSSVKRDLKRGIRMNTVIEEIDLFAGVKERPCEGEEGEERRIFCIQPRTIFSQSRFRATGWELYQKAILIIDIQRGTVVREFRCSCAKV